MVDEDVAVYAEQLVNETETREKEEPFVTVMERAPPFPPMHEHRVNEADEMWRGSEGTTLISTTAPFPPPKRVMFVKEHPPQEVEDGGGREDGWRGREGNV